MPTLAALTHRHRHALRMAVLVVVVSLLHAWLLGSLPRPPGKERRAPVRQAVQLRQVVPAVPAAVVPATPVLPVLPLLPALPALAAVPAPQPPPAAPPRRPSPAPLATASRVPPTEPAPPPAAPGGEPLPTYATRLPPGATLQYTVLRDAPGRGGVQAELRWRPDGENYTLTMGLANTGWASVGALDAHGLAPERHVETRRGRELRATNFQRQAGRITFSGPQIDYPLLPGSQDRLSWMLQLAGVMAADPALAETGREVQLFVAGVRGDAGVWTFTVTGSETAELPAGRVQGSVHLHREPQRPYDTRVDVWLDPARHHLPVRLRLQNRGEGDATEFLLATLDFD